MTRISRQFIESVIVTCVEGGITNCWAVFSWYKPKEATVTIRIRRDQLEDGILAGEFESGETGRYQITAEVIKRGVELILSGETDLPSETVRAYASQWRRVDFDVDSVAADIILQVGMFGKVIFG